MNLFYKGSKTPLTNHNKIQRNFWNWMEIYFQMKDSLTIEKY